MKLLFLILVTSLILLYSCSFSRQAKTTKIPFRIINNYALVSGYPPSSDTSFKIFANAEDFRKIFSMTKSSPGKAIIPNFDKEIVVALILPISNSVVTSTLDTLITTGKVLKAFYSITDTTGWKTYPHTPVTLAVFEKSVRFTGTSYFLNNTK